MKRMLMLVSLSILVLSAGFAQAQNDMMGLFFDEYGQSNCLLASWIAPYSTVELHLVLMEPSFDDLYGFEAGISVDGPVTLISVVMENANYIDIGSPGNHIVGFGTPAVMEYSNALATFTYMYMSTSNEDVCFKLHGSNPSSINPLYPTLLLADSEMQMVDVGNVYEDCSAFISDWFCNVTATEETTWDSLKTLYR